MPLLSDSAPSSKASSRMGRRVEAVTLLGLDGCSWLEAVPCSGTVHVSRLEGWAAARGLVLPCRPSTRDTQQWEA